LHAVHTSAAISNSVIIKLGGYNMPLEVLSEIKQNKMPRNKNVKKEKNSVVHINTN
jgi:hypothetical protein